MDQQRDVALNRTNPLPGSHHSTMYARLANNPFVLGLTFALYFALGKLALTFATLNDSVTAVWPSSGLALAAFMLFGTRIWPAIFPSAFLVYFTTSGNWLVGLAAASGNTVEGIIAAMLIDRFARGTDVFRSARTVFRFAAIAGFSAAITATCGATSLALTRVVPWADYAYVWTTWWFGNLSGILLIAPFVILWVTQPFGRMRWLEVLEAVTLLVLLVCVGFVVFGGAFPADVKTYPLEFLCVPFLLWAAFRFGRLEVASAITILSGIAVWGTLRGFGPFAQATQNESLVLVQAYTSVMAVMGIVLGSVVAEHKHAEAQLHELAITDPLTGLANYRRLIEVLRAEIARSKRTGRPFAVLFLDMNGLKRINDQYGHLVGSRALCRVAETLRQSCRTIDAPARFGGDEFAVVLAETAEEGGRLVLQRVSERLAETTDKPAVSVSGGIAVFPRDGDSPTLLLRAADRALYSTRKESASTRKPPVERKTGTLF